LGKIKEVINMTEDNVTIYTLEEFLAIDENKKKLAEAYARIVEKKQ
jgi:hypothetical protein